MKINATGAIPLYDRAQAQIKLLLAGKIDYVEAGDCRIPGLSLALRAISTPGADFPVAIYGASKLPRAEIMEGLSAEDAIARLSQRKSELEPSLGPCARVFGVKLRKASAES